MSRSSVQARDSARDRRGGALLVALALLALAAALLGGSAQASRAMSRSAQSYGAAISAESESRASLAELVAGWSGAYDSLRVGGSIGVTIAPRRLGAGGMVATTRCRVMRISASQFVVGLETSVGPEGSITARRRLSLILSRRATLDSSTTSSLPYSITQWGLSDLF
jgi:hypothetical protein